MSRNTYALAALVAAAALAEQVPAAEFCVTCAGPEAVYRCTIAELPAAATTDPRAQLTCIKEMAMLGGHERCSISRATQGPCQGVAKSVALPPARVPADAPAGETAAPPAAAPAPVPQNAVQPLPATPGVTVVQKTVDPPADGQEPAKSSLEKAGENVTEVAKKAGDAVGGVAKKTWDCMASLFKDC